MPVLPLDRSRQDSFWETCPKQRIGISFWENTEQNMLHNPKLSRIVCLAGFYDGGGGSACVGRDQGYIERRAGK